MGPILAGSQLTMRAALAGQQLMLWLKCLPVKSIHNALCVLLLLWILCALIYAILPFFSFNSVDDIAVKSPLAVGANNASKSESVDIARLQALNIFGDVSLVPANAKMEESREDDIESQATKTKLNLALEGIAYSSNEKDAVAVIVYQNKQDQYYVDDKLPVSGRVTLAKVLKDHVILSNNGKYESLWLYDDEKRKSVATKTPESSTNNSRVNDLRSSVVATKTAKDYQQRLYKNPKSLADVIRISPQKKNNQLVGYRISPGKDRKQFTEFGFKNNDIVTSINGIALNEPSKALEIYKLMRTANEATFDIDRNGEARQILVSLNATE